MENLNDSGTFLESIDLQELHSVCSDEDTFVYLFSGTDSEYDESVPLSLLAKKATGSTVKNLMKKNLKI